MFASLQSLSSTLVITLLKTEQSQISYSLGGKSCQLIFESKSALKKIDTKNDKLSLNCIYLEHSLKILD